LFSDQDAYIKIASQQQLQNLQEASKKELLESSDAPDIPRQRQALVNSAMLNAIVNQASGHMGNVTVTREEVIDTVGEQMAKLFKIRLTTPRSEAYHQGMLNEAWSAAQRYV
jgi:hypothetical protein